MKALMILAALALIGQTPAPPSYTQAAGPRVYTGVSATRTPAGAYMLHSSFTSGSANVAVYRNGLRQAQGIDYTWNAAAGVINPRGAKWAAEDIVLVDFTR